MTRSMLSKLSLLSLLLLLLTLPTGCLSASDDGSGGGSTPTTGNLVTTFGDIGFVHSNPSSGTFDINEVVMANSGTEIFLVGTYTLDGGSKQRGRIEKRSVSNGQLVAGFGTEGIYEADSSYNSGFNTGVTDSAGYLYVGGWDNDGFSLDHQWHVEKLSQSDGTLETDDFATSAPAGIYQKDWYQVTSTPDEINDMVWNSGGLLFLAGSSVTSGINTTWQLEMINSTDATPSASASSDPTNGQSSKAIALHLMDEGGTMKLWVLGTNKQSSTITEWRWEKRDAFATGMALDTTWPTTGPEKETGILTTSLGSGHNIPAKLEGDATHLYSCGAQSDGTDTSFRLEKMAKSTGLLDIPTFNSGGAFTYDPGVSDDPLYDLCLDQGNNVLYLVGASSAGGGPSGLRWLVIKLNATDGHKYDGTTNYTPEFGVGGYLDVDISENDDEARAALVIGNSLYIAGSDRINGTGNSQMRMEARLTTTGAQVSSIGTPGTAFSNPSGADADNVYDVIATGTHFYTVGSDAQNGSSDLQWRIEKRLLTTGALDETSFPTNGIIVDNSAVGSGTAEKAIGIARDSTDIYVVGSGSDTGGDWLIRKYDLDGVKDATFGDLTWTSGGSASDEARAIALDSTSSATKAYIAGVDGSANWTIKECILTSTPTWGWTATDTEGYTPYDIDVDATHLYVIGDTVTGGIGKLQKRALSDGTLDTGFGTVGTVPFNTTAGGGRALLVSGTNVIVAGMDGTSWKVTSYSTTDGSETWTSSNTPPTGTADTVYDMLLDGTNLYILGSTDESAQGDWAVLKLASSTGALVTSFGSSGWAISSKGPGSDKAKGAVGNAEGIIIVGESSLDGDNWSFENRTR